MSKINTTADNIIKEASPQQIGELLEITEPIVEKQTKDDKIEITASGVKHGEGFLEVAEKVGVWIGRVSKTALKFSKSVLKKVSNVVARKLADPVVRKRLIQIAGVAISTAAPIAASVIERKKEEFDVSEEEKKLKTEEKKLDVELKQKELREERERQGLKPSKNLAPKAGDYHPNIVQIPDEDAVEIDGVLYYRNKGQPVRQSAATTDVKGDVRAKKPKKQKTAAEQYQDYLNKLGETLDKKGSGHSYKTVANSDIRPVRKTFTKTGMGAPVRSFYPQ